MRSAFWSISLIIVHEILSHIEEIDNLIFQFSICVWIMIFYWTWNFIIFWLFYSGRTSKLLFDDKFMLIWKIVNDFINLVHDGFFKLIEVKLVGGKMFGNFFGVIFLRDLNQVINWESLLKISVFIEENILIWHFCMIDVIFLLNYIEIVRILIPNFNFLALHYFSLFLSIKCKNWVYIVLECFSIWFDMKMTCLWKFRIKNILIMMMA